MGTLDHIDIDHIDIDTITSSLNVNGRLRFRILECCLEGRASVGGESESIPFC